MTPLEERFRARLEIYKQQKGEISRDKNLKKRLDKLTNENDFQQQRKKEFTKVKNIASTPQFRQATKINYVQHMGGVLGNAIGSTANPSLFGREKKTKKSLVGIGGRLKNIAQGKRWLTSGWENYGSMPTERKPGKPTVNPRIKNIMSTYGTGVYNPYGTASYKNKPDTGTFRNF